LVNVGSFFDPHFCRQR